MTTQVELEPPKTSAVQPPKPFLSGAARKKLRENAIAWLFLAPSLFIVFIFGIFPILFAGYVSLYKWRIRQSRFLGLDNYLKAMGDIAYSFFFLIAIALAIYGIIIVHRAWKESRASKIPIVHLLLYIVPGVIIAAGLRTTILRAITIFAQEQSIEAGEAAVMGNAWIGVGLVILGTIIGAVINQWQKSALKKQSGVLVPNFTVAALNATLMFGGAWGLSSYTYAALALSERYGLAVVRTRWLLLSLIPLVLGYLIWRWSVRQHSALKLVGGLGGAIIMIATFVWLINLWPVLSKDADPEFYQSLGVTIMYALGTVPFQLGISMVLAYLLFQNIAAKGLFRIIFFIPYIAPAVATAGIFETMFSLRETSLANTFMMAIGAAPMRWLQESDTILAAIGESFGIDAAASWEFGPSLALLVVILYNIWVYVGYDTVIFLAGLGNIPNTLYEAARIDGASPWQVFRHITFPLLSPTTYFLSVISVIGTFKAFNHIYILRNPAAQGTVDTASVLFFDKFQRASSFGYATSMAIVLFVVILVLYFIQNRIAERTVHYG